MSKTENHLKRRIFAAIDISVMDEYIFSFLKKNAHLISSEKILFIHIAESDTNVNELNDKLKEEMEKHFPEAVSKHELLVVKGDPEDEIKNWSSKGEIDILVLGDKATADREVALQQVVNKSSTSLLILPKKEDYTIRKIGVATDFSDVSKLAVKQAHYLSEQLDAKLVGFHAYEVPSGYHKTGKDHEEFAEIMEEKAEERAKGFWNDLEFEKPEMQYEYDKKQEPSKCIYSFAEGNEIDLMIIGSKGRTDAASALMGSKAERVMKNLNTVPLLVVKDDSSKMDLLDAIQEL